MTKRNVEILEVLSKEVDVSGLWNMEKITLSQNRISFFKLYWAEEVRFLNWD